MAKSKGWQCLTPHECGKCRDRLTEQEFEYNRDQGRYGKELRCVYCPVEAMGMNDTQTQNEEA